MGSETTIIIGPVRTSFLHIWEAKAPKGSDKPVFSTQLVFDEDDTKTVAKVKAAIEAAEIEGKSKLEGTPLKKQRRPLYTGEEEFPGEDFYKGKLYLNASNTRQPGIGKKVNGKVVSITEEEEMYSGAWVYAEINFFAYNKVGVGIGCSLQNLLKAKDGERLDGRKSVEATFGSVDFEDTEEDDSTPTNIKASTKTSTKEAKASVKEEDEDEPKKKAVKKPNPFDD